MVTIARLTRASESAGSIAQARSSQTNLRLLRLFQFAQHSSEVAGSHAVSTVRHLERRSVRIRSVACILKCAGTVTPITVFIVDGLIDSFHCVDGLIKKAIVGNGGRVRAFETVRGVTGSLSSLCAPGGRREARIWNIAQDIRG